MASLTQWTWVWANSWSWWWTGRLGMLQFMGLQRVGHDWATELNWLLGCGRVFFFFVCLFVFSHFFKFYFIFKLYITVLVLPNIKMNPPQVYMCLVWVLDFCAAHWSHFLFLSSPHPLPLVLFSPSLIKYFGFTECMFWLLCLFTLSLVLGCLWWAVIWRVGSWKLGSVEESTPCFGNPATSKTMEFGSSSLHLRAGC